ncbi:hypothetical protein ACGFZS_47105 [Streptomyces sp. NPDC048288]|uniref:hypothetical protein n=1 Tax=Streptomyces sp. NPDC048288 TaxID=3365529 RepID=UPI003715E845
MATNQRTAKKTTPAQRDAAKKAPARKTPAKKPTTRRPAKKIAAAPLPQRDKPFMTDIQAFATVASRLAGITTPLIRDWNDHRNGTATRPLHDGSHLHYVLATRTLTWHAICPMGATHTYTLDRPSTATAARLHTDRCTETHATFTHIPRLTPEEWAELGIQTGPTWARPDLAGGDPITETIPVPIPVRPRALGDHLTRARSATAETQPMTLTDIAAGLTARAEQAKEHPQP